MIKRRFWSKLSVHGCTVPDFIASTSSHVLDSSSSSAPAASDRAAGVSWGHLRSRNEPIGRPGRCPSAVMAADWTASGCRASTRDCSSAVRSVTGSSASRRIASARRAWSAVAVFATRSARVSAWRAASALPSPATPSRCSTPFRTAADGLSIMPSSRSRLPSSDARADVRRCAPSASPSSAAARHHAPSADVAAPSVPATVVITRSIPEASWRAPITLATRRTNSARPALSRAVIGSPPAVARSK